MPSNGEDAVAAAVATSPRATQVRGPPPASARDRPLPLASPWMSVASFFALPCVRYRSPLPDTLPVGAMLIVNELSPDGPERVPVPRPPVTVTLTVRTISPLVVDRIPV